MELWNFDLSVKFVSPTPLQENGNSKCVIPSKKGSIYGAVRGCTFSAHHGQAAAFFHSKKIGFRGRSHSNDSNLGGSLTCYCLFLVCSWHDLKKVAQGCLAKIIGPKVQICTDFSLFAKFKQSLLILIFKDNC